MKIKKIIVILLLIACSFAGAPFLMAEQNPDKKIIYAVVWRGCEEGCASFREYIAGSGLNAEIILRNADRDKSKLPEFVQEARSLKADLVLTWGTSVTLGMAGTLADQNNSQFIHSIPLVFMIVADPVGSKIIESYEKTGRRNITGTRNRPPESVNIKAIRSYNPAFKKLGLLFNRNENNSVLKMDEMRALSDKMEFGLVALELDLGLDGHPKTKDISPKVGELKAEGVDFIYLGSSSFLRANQDIFTKSAVDQRIPVLSPYESMVRNSNALLSVAARYEDVGRVAGEQARAILLDGKIPGDLPIRSVKQYSYLVNMKVARQLNLFPSVEILQYAQTVD